jgi:hypothetical protein
LRITSIEVAELLVLVRDHYADLAADAGRFITLDAPQTVSVEADPDRVRQVLSNLLDNAIRYGGGEIALRASPAADGVEISVSDHGPGFPSGFVDRAFERFSRADPCAARQARASVSHWCEQSHWLTVAGSGSPPRLRQQSISGCRTLIRISSRLPSVSSKKAASVDNRAPAVLRRREQRRSFLCERRRSRRIHRARCASSSKKKGNG